MDEVLKLQGMELADRRGDADLSYDDPTHMWDTVMTSMLTIVLR